VVTRRDTIAALGSGQPPCAIAVVRVSGPDAFAAVGALAGTLPPPRQAGLRVVRRVDGAPIDRALVLTFPAPASATGEDVVELHVHGGTAVIAAALDALTAQPCVRLAEPGEFTRRAFYNGRLDLTQAEGLADLLASTTEQQRAQALALADGALARRAADWRARLLGALAIIEAGIDFGDEVDVRDGLDARIADDSAAVRAQMVSALTSAARGERVREGLTVVLAGAPNVGKSSLLNALAGRDAAIVSPHAGTTRDPVEVTLDLGGVPVTLVDTAGLRDSDDPVEAEGIARARQRAARAHLVLTLSDDDDWTCAGERVRTKIDTLSAGGGSAVGAIGVSARTGEGIASLLEWLANWAGNAAGSGGDPALIVNARQQAAVAEACAYLAQFGAEHDPALQAEAVRLALRALGRLAGAVDVEDVLGAIFGQFCIGK